MVVSEARALSESLSVVRSPNASLEDRRLATGLCLIHCEGNIRDLRVVSISAFHDLTDTF